MVGAGVGRTGTTSLKLALERLLGGRCYHMYEVFQQPEHVGLWQAAVDGRRPRWKAIFGGCRATVDWPAASFWPELAERFPDALILLSERDSGDAWFRSVDETINELFRRPATPDTVAWRRMAEELLRSRFVAPPFERAAALQAYEAHNARVREVVPADRLVVWRPGDGWAPLCERLGVPVPEEPFPHVNTRDEYKAVLDETASSP